MLKNLLLVALPCGLVFVILVSLEWGLRTSLRVEERRLDRLEAERAALSGTLELVRTYELKRSKLERRIQIITVLRRSGCAPVTVWRSVASVLTEGGCFRVLRIEESRFDAHVSAPDLPSLVEAAERLAGVEGLEKVEIREPRSEKVDRWTASLTGRCSESRPESAGRGAQ